MGRLQLSSTRSDASRWLDLLRGLAAVYVMIFHLRPKLYVGFQSVSHPNLIVKLLYFGTSMGYQAVMVFFVLSGYLISSSVLRAVSEDRWSWREYLINRVTRLWLVLIPALVLTLVWDSVSARFPLSQGLFPGTLGWKVFAGNVFFLQGVVVTSFGQNVPLWSLSYEFWYYILFPCIVLALRERALFVRLAYAFAALCLSVLLGKTIMLYFAVWLLGTVLVFLPPLAQAWRRRRIPILAVSLGALSAAMVAGELRHYSHAAADRAGAFVPEFIVGLTMLVVLYAILNLSGSSRKAGWRNASSVLAGCSYTLYLTHWPVLEFLRVWLGFETWQPDARHLSYGALVCAALLVYAWAISRVTEAHTGKVRTLLSRGLLRRDRGHGVSQPQTVAGA